VHIIDDVDLAPSDLSNRSDIARDVSAEVSSVHDFVMPATAQTLSQIAWIFDPSSERAFFNEGSRERSQLG
jgi:hypothetical protein